MNSSKKLVLIDGYGFIFRAYYSCPPLTNSNGTPVGAVFGFTNMIIRLLTNLVDNSHLAIAFDTGGKTFRHDIYSDYKANRPPCPPDLLPQFSIIRESAEALQIPVVEKKGFEADDVIATIVKKAKENNFKQVTIVSSDKDLMQLIDEDVCMFDAMKNKIIKNKEVKEKFFVEPSQLLDMFSLVGDSSDNVPGIKGIGVKIASQLILQYGSLNNLLENIDGIKQKKRREILLLGRNIVEISKKLISLNSEVPLNVNLDDFLLKERNDKILIDFLDKYEFSALSKKIRRESKNNEYYNHNKQFDKIDSDSEFLNLFQEEVILNGNIIINYCDNNFYFSTLKDEVTNRVYLVRKTDDRVINFFKFLALRNDIKIISFDVKEWLKEIYRNHKILFSNVEDIKIMSYIINSNKDSSSLELLIEDFLKEFNKEKCQFQETLFLGKLYYLLEEILFEKKLNEVYYSIDKPLTNSLIIMECSGIEIDKSHLSKLSLKIEAELNNLSQVIYEISGEKFNIASPKQLSYILFEKLNLNLLSTNKKSKSGTYSTKHLILQELSSLGYEIADLILRWRHLNKLKTTYIETLPEQVENDARIYTNFSATNTVTGRLSSYKPNLQNIPIKTKEGREIRRSFVAAKDHSFILADYSQIELRIVAHIANVKELKNSFSQGEDIHESTAKKIFNLEKVNEDFRRRAKAINFGIIYGLSPFGLSKQLNIPYELAKTYIENYFLLYPEIKDFNDFCCKEARKNGFITSIFGRKCALSNINSNNPVIRSAAERLAINAPIQGSAADIIKKSMIKLTNHDKIGNNLILQIHDELVLEVKKDEAKDISLELKKIMEEIVDLTVKLEINLKIDSHL